MKHYTRQILPNSRLWRQRQQGLTAFPKTSTHYTQNHMKTIKKTTSPDHKGSAFVENALQTVTQGLKSMQALQARTAEAHQKFLGNPG